MKYDTNNFTYGYEIEWGDIDRRLTIPEHLGAWEYAETDIVNIHEPYRFIACDPLGEVPPFGGEVNTKPTATWQEQVDRIMELQPVVRRCWQSTVRIVRQSWSSSRFCSWSEG